jgi:hypothetical protein
VQPRDAGWSRQVQAEAPIVLPSPPVWSLHLENPAGGRLDTTLAAPPVLGPWPRTGRLIAADATTELFVPKRSGDRGLRDCRSYGAAVANRRQSDDGSGMGCERGALAARARHGFRGPGGGITRTPTATVRTISSCRIAAARNWWLTRPAARIRIRSPGAASAERVLGFFQLDADAASEAILSSRDSLYLYDDVAAGAPLLLQALANPNRLGFDVFGADAAVGDLRADGGHSIACGDAEGHVAVFVRTAATTTGTCRRISTRTAPTRTT